MRGGVIDERRQRERNAAEGNGNLHEIIGAITALNARQNYPRRHMLANACSISQHTLFRNLSKIFLHLHPPRDALRCSAALLHFSFPVRSRFIRTDGEIDDDDDADGAARRFLSRKFWVLITPRIFRGRKALMDHIPR